MDVLGEDLGGLGTGLPKLAVGLGLLATLLGGYDETDPRAAANALRVDPSSPAAVPAKDRVEDLIAFVAGACSTV